MLYLYPSNKTDNLALVLAELMRAAPLDDPFQSDLVLTQSHGMGVWLNQKISSVQGVSCMVDTMMPGAFLWRLVDKLGLTEEGVSTVQHFEKNNLRWEIYRRLPTLLEQSEFSPLKLYLDGLSTRNEGLAPESALFQVCELLADNFDAYQNYRPEWLAAWDQNQSISDAKKTQEQGDEAWQRSLWRALYPNLKFSERRHRALQLELLIDALRAERLDTSLLPTRLFVFGMAAIPVQWLQVFLALGQHIDIHFMFQNPCRYYWGDTLSPRQSLLAKLRSEAFSDQSAMLLQSDDVDAHPLLSSLGGLGKNYLSELYRYDEEDGLSEFSADFFEQNTQGSALAHIKNDMLSGELSIGAVDLSDDSIRFSRCHSRLRELESLRDYLLALFAKNPTIAPRDIIVMAPDIQEYSALIHAVFSEPVAMPDLDNKAGGRSKTQRLPYGISDQSLSHEQPFLDALLEVLHFDQSRLTIDQVFELLALAPVGSKLGFDEAQLQVAKSLCSALNIRWGLSESHRDRLAGGNNTGQANTWFAGLSRALNSYLLGDVSDLSEGLISFPLRTSETQILLGKMAAVLELIEDSAAALQGQRSVADWLARIQACWNEWFDFNVVDEAVCRVVNQSLESVREQVVLTAFSERVPFSVLSAHLQAELSKEKVSQRFLAGRINFCNLMPMRTVPFKVVCVLGMNEGGYPRHDTVQSFDLISQYAPRRGDRSRRNEDRYMFLEALLAAQDSFYISYQGFDPKNNSERFPSVLVSELQDVCLRSFTDGSEEQKSALLHAWTYEHRLQPYNLDYFSDDAQANDELATSPQLLSYNDVWRSLYELPAAHTSNPEQDMQGDLFAQPASVFFDKIIDDKQCALSTWEAVLANPLLHYYRNELGLRGSGLDESTPSTEPFDIDGLQGYRLALRFSDLWLASHTSSDADNDALLQQNQAVMDELVLLGEIPQAPIGSIKLERLSAKYARLMSRVADLGSATAHTMELDLSGALSGCSLKGEVYLSEQALVDVHFSSSAYKWIFGAWARHVVWNVYVGRRQPNTVVVPIRPNDAAIAESTPSNEDTDGATYPKQSICVWRSGQLSFPALSLGQAEIFLTQLIECFAQACVSPQSFLPEQAYHLLFGSARTPESAYTLSRLDDDSGLAWQRLASLSEHTELAAHIPEPFAYCCCEQMSSFLPEKPERGRAKADPETQIVIELERS